MWGHHRPCRRGRRHHSLLRALRMEFRSRGDTAAPWRKNIFVDGGRLIVGRSRRSVDQACDASGGYRNRSSGRRLPPASGGLAVVAPAAHFRSVALFARAHGSVGVLSRIGHKRRRELGWLLSRADFCPTYNCRTTRHPRPVCFDTRRTFRVARESVQYRDGGRAAPCYRRGHSAGQRAVPALGWLAMPTVPQAIRSATDSRQNRSVRGGTLAPCIRFRLRHLPPSVRRAITQRSKVSIRRSRKEKGRP